MLKAETHDQKPKPFILLLECLYSRTVRSGIWDLILLKIMIIIIHLVSGLSSVAVIVKSNWTYSWQERCSTRNCQYAELWRNVFACGSKVCVHACNNNYCCKYPLHLISLNPSCIMISFFLNDCSLLHWFSFAILHWPCFIFLLNVIEIHW